MTRIRVTLLAIAAASGLAATGRATDRLPSWNDGPAKDAIIQFVAKVTSKGSPGFEHRTLGQGTRCGGGQGLDRGEHEEGLETRVRV